MWLIKQFQEIIIVLFESLKWKDYQNFFFLISDCLMRWAIRFLEVIFSQTKKKFKLLLESVMSLCTPVSIDIHLWKDEKINNLYQMYYRMYLKKVFFSFQKFWTVLSEIWWYSKIFNFSEKIIFQQWWWIERQKLARN